ncbi:EAL domain-containing protein [Marinobacterium stanieri]|uniref:EAL domain-containing protein n=1 Tax=Marinobacterium stanieri TaxID=49186 RepID=UPI003A9196EA
MTSSTDQILSALSKHPTHRDSDTGSRNINILFAQCDGAAMELLLTNLRNADFAPRGLAIENLEALQQAFERRAWDILIFTWKSDYRPALSPEAALDWLKLQERDLPVILLAPEAQVIAPSELHKLGVAAVVPEPDHHWILHEIERQYLQLLQRRELRATHAELKHLRERNQYLVKHSNSAICYLYEGRILFSNDSFAHLLGYIDDTHLNNRQLHAFVVSNQQDRLTQCLRQAVNGGDGSKPQTITFTRPDQTHFEGMLSLSPVEYEGKICQAVEISEPECEEEAFRSLDPMTGLQNEHACMQALEAACLRALRGGQDRSLLLLRLDHLKIIRAEVGADGEALILRAIAHILKQKVSPAHLLGHLDDDSFMILMHNADPDKAISLGQGLCHAIRNHICDVDQVSIHTTVSVGIAMINDSTPDPVVLLDHARKAAASLHQGNRPGNGVQLYNPEQSQLTQLDGRMNKRLANALKRDRFRLLYQPVVPLRTASPSAYYEVLLRLVSDSNKAISPNAFIIQTIEPEILRELDRWVIEHALKALQSPECKAQNVSLFINLSGPSIRCNKLPEWLALKLTETSISPSQLIFQLSESDAAVDLMSARRFVGAMLQLNCRTCLKHFGSSPNSNHVRQELRTNFVKLDGSYMRDLQSDSLDMETLGTLVEPLLHQKRTLIAPQVENTQVIPQLYGAGIHLIQGHYLQPPRENMDYDFFGEADQDN